MATIDARVYRAFLARWTAEDVRRLQEVERSHEASDKSSDVLQAYPEAAGVMYVSPEWFDVDAYIGEACRFSASFRDPLGPQTVCRGTDNRGGVAALWVLVCGEFEAR